MKPNPSAQPFNPWPYGIVGFFALAILAAIVWVVFCIGHGSDLVAANYYELEVDYQQQIERVERTRQLSSRAGVEYAQTEKRLRVWLPREHVRDGLKGQIRLYRPSSSGLDQFIRLQVNEEGEQFVDVGALKAGLWDVQVEWTHEEQEYFLNQNVTIAPGSS